MASLAQRFQGSCVWADTCALTRVQNNNNRMARFRLVRLAGHKVRKVRSNAVDVHDVADVFLYRDSSIAPLLDMRRRFRAFIGVLGAMIRSGISLARSVELTAQWDRIVAIGPMYPVTLDDLHAVQGLGLGDFYRVVST